MVDPERYFNIILCANLAISYQNVEIYYLRSMYLGRERLKSKN